MTEKELLPKLCEKLWQQQEEEKRRYYVLKKFLGRRNMAVPSPERVAFK